MGRGMEPGADSEGVKADQARAGMFVVLSFQAA